MNYEDIFEEIEQVIELILDIDFFDINKRKYNQIKINKAFSKLDKLRNKLRRATNEEIRKK